MVKNVEAKRVARGVALVVLMIWRVVDGDLANRRVVTSGCWVVGSRKCAFWWFYRFAE